MSLPSGVATWSIVAEDRLDHAPELMDGDVELLNRLDRQSGAAWRYRPAAAGVLASTGRGD